MVKKYMYTLLIGSSMLLSTLSSANGTLQQIIDNQFPSKEECLKSAAIGAASAAGVFVSYPIIANRIIDIFNVRGYDNEKMTRLGCLFGAAPIIQPIVKPAAKSTFMYYVGYYGTLIGIPAAINLLIASRASRIQREKC